MLMKYRMQMLRGLIAVLGLTAVLSADPAPDVDLVDLDGNWHNMHTYVSQGKYIAYDFVTLG